MQLALLIVSGSPGRLIRVVPHLDPDGSFEGKQPHMDDVELIKLGEAHVLIHHAAGLDGMLHQLDGKQFGVSLDEPGTPPLEC